MLRFMLIPFDAFSGVRAHESKQYKPYFLHLRHTVHTLCLLQTTNTESIRGTTKS